MFRSIFTLSVCSLFFGLVGCADDSSAPACETVEIDAPSFPDDGDLIMLPGSEWTTSFRGVPSGCVGAESLVVEVESDVVEASVVDSEFFGLRIVSTAEGSGTIAARLDGEIVDELVVTVSPLTGFDFIPGEEFIGSSASVPEPWGVITDHGVLLVTQIMTEQGPVSDSLGFVDEVEFEDRNAVTSSNEGIPNVRFAEPGEYTGTLPVQAAGATTATGTVTAVAPEEIVELSIAVRDSRISVLGVSEDGVTVIGLAPEVRLNGERVESSLGSWLFRTDHESGDELTVTWNGLEQTLTFD